MFGLFFIIFFRFGDYIYRKFRELYKFCLFLLVIEVLLEGFLGFGKEGIMILINSFLKDIGEYIFFCIFNRNS